MKSQSLVDFWVCRVVCKGLDNVDRAWGHFLPQSYLGIIVLLRR